MGNTTFQYHVWTRSVNVQLVYEMEQLVKLDEWKDLITLARVRSMDMEC